MGGILSPSQESEILKLIKQDKSNKLKEFIIKNDVDPSAVYTKRKRTLIQLCCYFSSPKCLSKLIEMNYDYNQKEISNNFTPLYIACKFNCIQIVKILLSQKNIMVLQKSNEGFNEFEIAFLKGNYDICYYLLYEYKNKNKSKKDDKLNINNKNNEEEINTGTRKKEGQQDENEKNNNNEGFEMDMNHPYQQFFFRNFDLKKYLDLQSTNQFPLFNMQLFYESLTNKLPYEKCDSFAAERKRTKDLQTKIPDPNETWGHFFKRVANMELYNPPLVDKRNVSQMNSLYMNAQMKLIENEYGIKMQFNEVNDTTRNVLDQDLDGKESDIFKIQNTEKKPLNEEAENCSISKSHLKDYANNNILNNEIKIRNKEKKIEEIKDDDKDEDKDENVCIIKINKNNIIQSEDRLLKEKKEEEEN